MTKRTILAVDDEADMLKTYESILKKKYSILLSDSSENALKILKENNIDLMLLDIRMPKIDGIELLKQIKSKYPDIDVIMVSASKDVASAVEAMKLGAFDYIAKPFDVDELLLTIKRALEKRELVKENLYLKETLTVSAPEKELIGNNPRIKSIRELIKTVADADSTVLISGESGSGKEIAARSIHDLGKRKDKPFVAINCAAIPDNLLESELFGYERGAFTGAHERKIGKFELADSGTLFLDEIGCMAPAMQGKLLRMLEDRKIERLGGSQPIEIDVRIIAATNIKFREYIKEGKFREDLYYRLNVIPIDLPPLRERKEDLELFISFFISRFNKEFNKKIEGVSKGALKILLNYEYPGNVRELQNILERAVVLAKTGIIEEDQLFGIKTEEMPEESRLEESLKNYERNMILGAMKEFEGNQVKAARKLGIARTTLSSKLRSLKIR